MVNSGIAQCHNTYEFLCLYLTQLKLTMKYNICKYTNTENKFDQYKFIDDNNMDDIYTIDKQFKKNLTGYILSLQFNVVF